MTSASAAPYTATAWIKAGAAASVGKSSKLYLRERTASGATRTVALRQLMSVSTSGRAGKALILLYHPDRGDGMLDLDDVRSLVLPALDEQDALQSYLEAQVPA